MSFLNNRDGSACAEVGTIIWSMVGRYVPSWSHVLLLLQTLVEEDTTLALNVDEQDAFDALQHTTRNCPRGDSRQLSKRHDLMSRLGVHTTASISQYLGHWCSRALLMINELTDSFLVPVWSCQAFPQEQHSEQDARWR